MKNREFLQYICLALSAFLVLFANESLAIPADTFATNVQSGEDRTLSDIISTYSALKERTNVNRREFESLATYEKRVRNAKAAFDEYVSKRYKMNFGADKVDLDWESSSISITTAFPTTVARQRGGGNPGKKLRISVSISPSTAREAHQFPQYINMFCRFHINTLGMIVIDHLTVKYFEKTIYEE